MTKITDETLMLYVDGALDLAEREQVETLLASNSEASERVQVLRTLGRSLAELMYGHVQMPAPQRPPGSIAPPQIEPAPPAGDQRDHRSAWFEKWAGVLHLPPALSFNAGMASAMVLIVVASAGWFAHGNGGSQGIVSGDLVHIENNRVFAKAPLLSVLETFSSGTGVKLPDLGRGTANLVVHMTFRNEARDFCREYEIAGTSPERYGGIACRDSTGQWSVVMHALIAPSPTSSGQIVPAGSANPAIDSVVLSHMDGNPLEMRDEASAIARGWRK